MPPPLKIRSPQRIVSLQYLHDQIELQGLSIGVSRYGAGDTILREPYKVWFEYIKRHAGSPIVTKTSAGRLCRRLLSWIATIASSWQHTQIRLTIGNASTRLNTD
jgi:hypothetical protein